MINKIKNKLVGDIWSMMVPNKDYNEKMKRKSIIKHEKTNMGYSLRKSMVFNAMAPIGRSP